MNRAITWVLIRGDSAFRYIVLDKVLIAVELDVADPTAIAEAFDSAADAHTAAVEHTRRDEDSGYVVQNGQVQTIVTYLSPEKISEKYREPTPPGSEIRSLLVRLDKGRGVPL